MIFGKKYGDRIKSIAAGPPLKEGDRMDTDQLKLYRGSPVSICDGIELHIPTLDEICSYGEDKYYSMVHMLCSTGIDLCWQLEEMGIPFDEISDYLLFCQILRRQYTSDDTRILFGDQPDLSAMELYVDENSHIFLFQPYDDGSLIINEDVYLRLVTMLRKIHGLKRDDRVAGTKSCRMAFIEDAKMEYEARKNEPSKSTLLQMVSTMTNMEGFKRDDTTVWAMNIYAFMDSVKRIAKIRNSTLLMQSGYSGFGVDLNKIKQEELNYMGELS